MADVHTADPEASRYVRSRRVHHEPGLDLKYAPSSNLTLDVTVNPDFAQVEADAQRVNLTRFSLFFPERRPFFQERASVFEYSLGGDERIFHSRRIGLVGDEPIRIYGGARLVARANGWDVGLLNMQTEGTEVSGPENAGVVRVQRRVLNPYSTAGAIATTRLDRSGRRHLTWDADARVRLSGRDYLTLNLAESRDRSHDHAVGLGDRAFARVRWERRGIYGLAWDLEAARVGARFEPALGFVSRNDYSRARIDLSHGWRAADASRLLGHALSLRGSAYRAIGGDLESAVLGPEWGLETKSGHTVFIGFDRRYEDLEQWFAIGPAVHVPAGVHRFTEAAIRYSPADNPLRVSARAVAGEFYDGRRVSLQASPVWIPSAHLQLSGTYQWTGIRFPTRDQRFESHIARLRARYMLNTRISSTAFVQYNSAGDALAVNVRFRYNPREGDDLYLVYDHAFNTDRSRLEPTPPLTAARTVLLKYSRTFTLGF